VLLLLLLLWALCALPLLFALAPAAAGARAGDCAQAHKDTHRHTLPGSLLPFPLVLYTRTHIHTHTQVRCKTAPPVFTQSHFHSPFLIYKSVHTSLQTYKHMDLPSSFTRRPLFSSSSSFPMASIVNLFFYLHTHTYTTSTYRHHRHSSLSLSFSFSSSFFLNTCAYTHTHMLCCRQTKDTLLPPLILHSPILLHYHTCTYTHTHTTVFIADRLVHTLLSPPLSYTPTSSFTTIHVQKTHTHSLHYRLFHV
jgi:hypothetical protein